MSPREQELEQLLRWAVAETGPVPVPMGAPGADPFPLRYPDWAEDARAVLAGAPSMPIGEACEVLARACTPDISPSSTRLSSLLNCMRRLFGNVTPSAAIFEIMRWM